MTAAKLAIATSAFIVFGFLSSAVTSAAVGADNVKDSPFYLVIGASESVGLQPTAASPRGQRTDDGYPNDIVDYEASLGVTLDLHELGCPNETTLTAITGDRRCYPAPDSQLGRAVAFLRSHQSSRGIVTIDLGFNDVKSCLWTTNPVDKCLDRQSSAVRDQLTTIIRSLLQAAGPRVSFIGLNHGDPYLALSHDDSRDSLVATNSVAVIRRLNSTLRDVYSSFGIPVANVAAAFSFDDSDEPDPDTVETSPDVDAVCQLTWMCAPAPQGPNIHPNDAGYRAIARAIEPLLPALGGDQPS